MPQGIRDMASNEVAQQERPKTATEVCCRYNISDEARQLLDDNIASEVYLNALVQRELYEDAVQFMANYLPKPEAI